MFEGKMKGEPIDFNAQQIVFETPLYEIIKLTEGTARQFSELFNAGETKIDGYCVGCGRDSVFHSLSIFSGRNVDYDDLKGIKVAKFFCARDKTHIITIFTEMDYQRDKADLDLAFHKIGQVPTHADIANGNLGEFKSVLKGADRSEIIRANGLAAHGVNIGAFVYLRRVFERLIGRARLRMSNPPPDADFTKLRMEEKISALSSVLPAFLVKNKKVYSVLSKGIHELDEDTCGKHYELMRMSIQLMLEQERDIVEREAKESQLAKLISDLET